MIGFPLSKTNSAQKIKGDPLALPGAEKSTSLENWTAFLGSWGKMVPVQLQAELVSSIVHLKQLVIECQKDMVIPEAGCVNPARHIPHEFICQVSVLGPSVFPTRLQQQHELEWNFYGVLPTT